MLNLIRKFWLHTLVLSGGVASAVLIQRSITTNQPSGPRSALWGDDAQCTLDHDHSSSTGYAALDVFTADGSYLPRTHCIVSQTGETDWSLVWLLFGLNAIVITGYFRIFGFWRKAYLQEEVHDRNKKLMDLAWIFLFCAICGYVSSIVLFFWPAYRLLALMLIPLGFFTWKFAANLEDFKISLSAKRLARQLNESLTREKVELESKVQEATENLRIAKDCAERSDSAKGEFLANMSHEIRTPLSAIIGYTDIVLDDPKLHPDQRREIQGIKQHSGHLLGVINDILDVTQIESGNFQYQETPCSISDLVEEVVEIMSIRARRKGIGIYISVHKSIPDQVFSDPIRIKQMVSNIIRNAVKFTDSGDIFVEVMPNSTAHKATNSKDLFEFSIIVRDNGIGIAPDKLEAIFESFTQENKSIRNQYGGCGLGLSISQQIARDLGGDIVAESGPGFGALFTCTFSAPITNEIINKQHETSPHRPVLESKLSSSRILLVEDGADNRILVEFHFNKIGIQIDTAHDGLMAKKKVNQMIQLGTPYDIILMDISMPKMDGIQCTTQLRNQGISTPIIMLTAHALQDQRDKCFAAGANAYHCKPIDFTALFQTCTELLEEPGRRVA